MMAWTNQAHARDEALVPGSLFQPPARYLYLQWGFVVSPGNACTLLITRRILQHSCQGNGQYARSAFTTRQVVDIHGVILAITLLTTALTSPFVPRK